MNSTTSGTASGPASYGGTLYAAIKASITDYSKASDFERFVLNCGYEFDTEAELAAAFQRSQNASGGILLTQEEFLAEAQAANPTLAAETYKALVKLVDQQILKTADVYQYARYKWCLPSPEAIVAYQTGPHNTWSVNNCDTKITEDRARLEVCEEWGFEASRVRIIGQPYYDATDWNFIRFDCAHITWLMCNGELYQVYR